MNRSEPLTDELIQAMFERRAERAAVGSLGEEILAATASTRQRSVLGLRLAGAWPRLNSRPAWIALAVLAALLGVVLALALSGHRQPGPLQTGLLAFIRAGDVYLADPDGSNARVVLHQDGATFATTAWAPGGDRLAVDGDAGVVVLDAATGGTTRIGGSNPVWSPDGQELATIDPPGATVRPDGPHLRIVEMATGATSHDYPFPAIGGLAWSPNGRWIAATGGTSGAANALARIDVTTGQWVEIDGASGMLDSERQPAWSPDSLHIAFIRWGAEGVANCHGSPLCETDVFVANPDGSNPVRLNRVAGKADQPAWSPDGRWIAYAAAGTGIVIVRPDGTGERTIAADGVAAFAWGPESDRVRYLSVAAGQSVETLWDAPLDGAAHQVDVALGVPPHQFERSGGWFAWQTMASDRAIPPLPSVTQPAPTARRSTTSTDSGAAGSGRAFQQSPLAEALRHLAVLAKTTVRIPIGSTVNAMATDYAEVGWQVDDAMMRALAAVSTAEDVSAVEAAIVSVYGMWLEDGAIAFQKAAAGAYEAEAPPDWPAGTCVIFSDGLRYDIGKRLASALSDRGLRVDLTPRLTALPTVTNTGKPFSSPVRASLGSGPGMDPAVADGGSRVSIDVLRKQLSAGGYQVLGESEVGDPSGRAWAELGDIDSLGHDQTSKLPRLIDGEIASLVERIRGLLSHGWQQVAVVTDHGWLYLPGGLPKVDLPAHLTEGGKTRKARCARLATGSSTTMQTVPWTWDADVSIAIPPGSAAFQAGQVYEHGGVKPAAPRPADQLGRALGGGRRASLVGQGRGGLRRTHRKRGIDTLEAPRSQGRTPKL